MLCNSIPYAILCPVYFLRYPNPLASHVISVDVLARDIVRRPDTRGSGVGEGEGQWRHVLKTTRLILKRGTLPSWAPRGIIKNAESWVLEETEVDLDPPGPSSTTEAGGKGKGREFSVWTRNLDHTHVMAVTERTTYREQVAQQQGSAGTSYRSCFDITSDVALLHNRIERFGLKRVVTHADTSRVGLLETQQRFIDAQLGRLPAGAASAAASAAAAGGRVAEKGGDIVKAGQPSKKQRLVAALRPPFLDGDFVGPIARMKVRLAEVRGWWGGLVRGGTAGEEGRKARSASAYGEEVERDLTPTERLRKRFFFNLQRAGQDEGRIDDEEA